MVYIGSAEIPGKKNLLVGLTQNFGIGKTIAKIIIANSALDPHKRIKDLTIEEISILNTEIKKFPTGEKLREEIQKRISDQIRIGTYRGIRRSRKPNALPVNGKSTGHNARTAKGHKRKTVANKKKAPKQ